MGWKNVKEHYRIGHIVQVAKEGVCIGSGYIHDLIVIGMDGNLKKRYENAGNDDLMRCQREMDADPEMLRHLMETPDTFSRSVTVYTYDGGNIIEKQCEEPGYPNVTHDGCLMYQNMYSTNKDKVATWAKSHTIRAITNISETVHDLEEKLSEKRALIAEYEASLKKLKADYPTETAV
ncbi:hypothetical protein HFQ13_10550 [Acidithiobacillus sp. VAN18-1]|uniref:Uncharacterized protein n=1 Tax=Igneacidithiobacillus copahuensis TaxID=2724909 RepID=A0AAE3CKL8_9PROT|nr:hypothetical protein [Igneacidithiobacillus copahuensis]MBU2788630.1 hypothetical protein [Igneacidithiobacillus copahuensis]MBU2796686.1 hypothetical protein [Acidithiobacillus sp. VAN18-2]